MYVRMFISANWKSFMILHMSTVNLEFIKQKCCKCKPAYRYILQWLLKSSSARHEDCIFAARQLVIVSLDQLDKLKF